MKEFYFIFNVMGAGFIEMLKMSLKNLPDNYNIIVTTNLPHLLDDLDPNYNLIVLDLKDLEDEWSKENESWIDVDNEEEFWPLLEKNLNSSTKFPYSKQRYIFPWLIKKNITKFIFLDSDCFFHKYSTKDEWESHTNQMLNYINGEHCTFGRRMDWFIDLPFLNDQSIFIEELFKKKGFGYKEIFNEDRIKEEDDTVSMKTSFSTQGNYGLNVRVFDGWIRGYNFKNTNIMEEYFSIWDEITKDRYTKISSNPYGGSWIVNDEWILGLINEFFQAKYDMKVSQAPDFIYNNILNHVYHPENSYWDFIHLIYNEAGLITTKTRKEFYKKNKNNIIKFYKYQNNIDKDRLKEFIYDWPY